MGVSFVGQSEVLGSWGFGSLREPSVEREEGKGGTGSLIEKERRKRIMGGSLSS
jgi:hypothetical protein